jgi:predicted nucleic acid-binding protein
MVNATLDTSVVIDLLRGYAPALAWFEGQSAPGVSRIVWMEIIEGARDRTALRQALNLLKRFETLELTPEDSVWATEKLIAFNLSHNIDSFDCLIAAVNYRLQIPLYTANLKHFQPILGDLCRRPY